MNSDLPKVAHEVAGQPMVRWVVEAVRTLGAMPVVLVVGYGQEHVRSIFDGERGVAFVVQEQQLGTGHAVQQAQHIFDDVLLADADVFVLAGDGPLIRPETLQKLLETHRRTNAVATLATAVIDDPTGYGRILRDDQGQFDRIVEHKDATPQQLEIREVNPSYYCFHAATLFDYLSRTDNNNAAGEYYITDVLQLMRSDGLHVQVVDAVPSEDVLSINTPQQLAEVSRILKTRLEPELMERNS